MGKLRVAKEGRSVKVHYRGTLDDGTVFDSSYERQQPIGFQVGGGQMIKGFDEAVDGMKVGETKKVNIPSDQAYGPWYDQAVRNVPRNSFPEDFDFKEGVIVEGEANGQPVRGAIVEIEDETVTIDFNHPLSGKDLNFDIELVEVNK